ncbi:MAG: DUF2281 domain-containing protein [Candidatus Electrothrix sp. LOE2]|nr:DUF2281 domain-containing protein [Candidatus Electrothrix sp. LOE2]
MTAITQKIIENLGALPPDMQEETLNFVQFLKEKLLNSKLKQKKSELNGTKLARLMEEASKKNLFADIKNPAEWQREIRKERSLPGRES